MPDLDRHFDHLDPAALNPSPLMWEKLRTICLGLVIVGAIGVAIGWPMNPDQFYHSWLTSWSFCWTTLMGVLFFVMLHHLVDAGWSTVVRRPSEQMLIITPWIVITAIPAIIGLYSGHLHHWINIDPATDELLQKKHWWLNVPFLSARLVFYALVFIFLSRIFRRNSLRQDKNGDARWTLSSRRWSAGGMPLYALAVSFCAFDLLMALDHHWFSTIFGVYVWSGGVVAGLCVITLVSLSLRQGPLRQYIGSDQVHDLGKLIFAFCAFWAYIAFSQYFLVWYGNIPEETIWFLNRWTGSSPQQGAWWWTVSILLATLRFVLPFFILMSAHTKRTPRILATMCIVLLIGHFVDQYWLVQPNIAALIPPLKYLWIDLSALCLISGVSGLLYVKALRKAPLFPVMDPRLVEALSAEHVEEIEHADQD